MCEIKQLFFLADRPREGVRRVCRLRITYRRTTHYEATAHKHPFPNLHPADHCRRLGYFFNIHDPVLFSIGRAPSLKALDFSCQALIDNCVFLFHIQMAGILAGWILRGILGDNKGRLTIMFRPWRRNSWAATPSA